MGATLPKPVKSTVVERHESAAFRVGVAEMNGWRVSMEDSHLIHMKSDWGFFGVFDGHGGDKCSAYVSPKLREELETHGCPKDDAAIKDLILRVDQAYLDTEQPSGSTATMCIVQKSASSDKHKLTVINAGDSRILLGRRDGTIVDGGGTDQGLTRDHKPSDPDERERIYRCGGTVEEAAGGIARVNGELAVSRGFGDAEYKRTGGPSPEDRPVTANPEIGHFDCSGDTDFIVLCCDGVCEAEYTNPEVIQLVAEHLKESDDLGAPAKAVCHKAVETGSKDNITCMIVLLTGSDKTTKEEEFIPGPLTSPDNKSFMTAYEAMAKKAGLTLAQAAELRYDQLLGEQASTEARTPEASEALEQELAKFGSPAGTGGSEERSAWFRAWLQGLSERQSNQDVDGADSNMVLMRDMLFRLMNGDEQRTASATE
eukprot:CAMPEP_0179281466 /NCGR_PEP_ID=MMETSP0797-20121207/37166_1 /TAXON_ID=47934 /ORGANISM="Dinophysis acuminata, Strain DAEP01" /LENGTH=427 /DNA_ID=CAMNT_0020990171 /DNA_START=101 /DNA_END=1384 /DNA_ORIENTATION=+